MSRGSWRGRKMTLFGRNSYYTVFIPRDGNAAWKFGFVFEPIHVRVKGVYLANGAYLVGTSNPRYTYYIKILKWYSDYAGPILGVKISLNFLFGKKRYFCEDF